MAPVSPKPHTEQSDLSALKGRLPLLGLTGGIGSGKSAVSDMLAKLGAGIIDTDLIAHQITAPGGLAIPQIQAQFGAAFIQANGALDRNKMRALVFTDPQARQALESITHPLIRQETMRQAHQLHLEGVPYLVFVVPLLIESTSWKGLIDHLAVVDCSEESQIKRVMQRSKLARSEVESILNAQATRQERLTQADTVLENQASLEALSAEVHKLHQKILQIRKD